MSFSFNILLRSSVIALYFLCASSSGLFAQSLFKVVAHNDIDYSAYKSHYECIAAYRRIVSDSVANQPWLDTAKFRSGELNISIPGKRFASRAIQECMGKFNDIELDTAVLFGELVRALILADRDEEAREISFSNLTYSVKDSIIPLRKKALNRLRVIYRNVRPVPIEKIRHIDEEYSQLLTTDETSEWKKRNYHDWDQIWELVGDSSNRYKNSKEFLSNVDLQANLPIEQRKRIVASAWAALSVTERDVLRDSLELSTAAYTNMKKEHWELASGGIMGNFSSAVGLLAPPIEYDFRINNDGLVIVEDSSEFYTNRNKSLKMVVFIAGCIENSPGRALPQPRRLTGRNRACWDEFATLKRLADAYPNMEIVVYLQTKGYIAVSNTLEPEAEVEAIKEWLLNSHDIPVSTILVKRTGYFNLPAPDSRRIDEDDINRKNYSFDQRLGGALLAYQLTFFSFLLDSEGRVVHYGSLYRGSEPEFIWHIDAVYKQKVKPENTRQ